jgi:2-isopropylmalate synthase
MMKMLKNPATKYHSFKPINLTDRQWPSRTITRAPIWMSTDLRDGNQALFEPMNAQRKMRMFKTLVQIGFKEIEVAFPSICTTPLRRNSAASCSASKRAV